MRCFDVINMPYYGALLTVNHFIGHTSVIWVDLLESPCFQLFREFLPK
jgi:hypothetical protein